MTAITVRDLDVDLDRSPVVRGVSCAAASGSWLALLGPNGAGKTTVLRAMAGLLRHRGTVLLGETSAASLPARERARLIAYVPQAPVLPPDMTVQAYILLGRTPHLGYLAGPGRADQAAADRAGRLLQVADLAGRRLASLSGGEQQRVVLARALAQEPGVLLLDEPTSALDVGHQQRVLELVDELRRDTGVTVVTTLHDLTTAGQYADELVLLDQGRVEASGSARTVLTAARIGRVYSAQVAVSQDADGHLVVSPVRSQATGPAPGPRRPASRNAQPRVRHQHL